MKYYLLFIIIVSAALSSAVVAQTTTPNYVRSTIYQDQNASDNTALISVGFSDGLGRAMQAQSRFNDGATPGKYIVSGTTYDAAGRPEKSIKSFVAPSSGNFISDPLEIESRDWWQLPTGGKMPSESHFFSQTAYDSDPLSRVRETGALGNAFYLGNTGEHYPRIWYFGTAANSGISASSQKAKFMRQLKNSK
jgi:hypothetical protein